MTTSLFFQGKGRSRNSFISTDPYKFAVKKTKALRWGVTNFLGGSGQQKRTMKDNRKKNE